MFPRLRQKIGTALADRIDLMVEFSTLGEYALADDLLPVALHDDRPLAAANSSCGRAATGLDLNRSRSRDDCPLRPLSRGRAD